MKPSLADKRPVPFRGMMPILPTTITESGKIDEVGQRRLVRYCLQNGAVAIGHFGFASEFFKLSMEERREVARIVIDEVGGKVPVFLGTSGASARVAIEYMRQAEDLGADLLMISIPYVNIPDAAGVHDYYKQIGAETSLPIILQDTPISASILTPEFCYRLFNEVEAVQYVKAEGPDFLSKAANLATLTDGRMPVIGGFGGKHLIHNLRVGVTSYMTGTEILDLHNAVVQKFLAGDEEGAAQLYYAKLLPYFVFYEAYPEELLKKMLHLRGLIDCAEIIAPRATKPMGEVEYKEFLWVLERIGYTAPGFYTA